ncbi:MAG: response regulator [Novosphingobium sp.]
MKGDLLRGKRVLVLEDEPIIAMLLEELIEAAGGTAQCVTSLAGADKAIAEIPPDLAVLDINIHNQTSFDLARQLADRGVPFIFASGYGKQVVPPEMGQVPTVTKPYGLDELDRAFRLALGVAEG